MNHDYKSAFEKIDLENYDGSKINIPDIGTFNMLVEHTRNHYPELYKQHFEDSETGGLSKFRALDFDDVSVADAYVDFVGSLNSAVILPDGSELLSPLKKIVPVGFHQPKTLEQLINGSLNIGQIYAEYEKREEALYDAEREHDLFAEVMELSEKNPDFGQTIYDELAFARFKSSISNNSDTLQHGYVSESVLAEGQRGDETSSSGLDKTADKADSIE